MEGLGIPGVVNLALQFKISLGFGLELSSDCVHLSLDSLLYPVSSIVISSLD